MKRECKCFICEKEMGLVDTDVFASEVVCIQCEMDLERCEDCGVVYDDDLICGCPDSGELPFQGALF